MYELRIKTQPAIDGTWYQRLRDTTRSLNETFVMLESPPEELEAKRRDFFAGGCAADVDLRPRHVDTAALEKMSADLESLLGEIFSQEPDGAIRAAYGAHIRRTIDSLAMVRLAAEGDTAGFVELGTRLHGKPDREIFESVCAWIRLNAETAPAKPGSPLDVFRAAVLESIPDPQGDAGLIVPDGAVFRRVRELHFEPQGYFEQLFAPDGPPNSPYIEQTDGDALCRRVIANAGSDYEIVDAHDGLWAILPRTKQVLRPPGYHADRDYFTGIIAHEIGSHLLEEANGSRQPLRLLELGLAGFEAGNEGRAYMREQIVYRTVEESTRQSSWEYILMLHLSVCLASGLAGRPYSFSQLYEVLYALHRFWRERRYPLHTNNEVQASQEAWLLCVRIMKGTDGRGGAYMKDIVYLEGNIRCWELAARSPQLILKGDIGKFNLTDENQIDLLRRLRIWND